MRGGAAAWHVVACEYPPRTGGVGDYARLVAEGLAAEGEEVHVWCPPHDDAGSEVVENDVVESDVVENVSGVTVHREFGRFAPSDLRRVGRLLDACAAPRRLLVQYVPHGYGYGAMNVAFCAWLWKRARLDGDRVELMVHEPFLDFRGGTWRRWVAASAQRVMTFVLLRAAARVRVAIPAWGELWRPYALGRRVTFEWTPVPSTVPVVSDPEAVARLRALYVPPGGAREEEGGALVGHFGTYPAQVAEHLAAFLPRLLERREACAALLLGRGGRELRERLAQAHPSLAARLHAPGTLDARALSSHLAACDVVALPFPDGVSTRRTSAMAALAHGLALVTTRGRLSEPLWAESGAVELVEAGSPEATCAGVERLLADEDRRARLASAARALYRERFPLARTVSALRGVAEESKAPPAGRAASESGPLRAGAKV